MLCMLRRPHTPGARPVCLGLWKRLQEHSHKYPDIESYLVNKVLPRVAPDFKP